MIAYLDASALVKRYLVERGWRETIALTAESELIATSIVTRAEVAAAFAKAARAGLVSQDRARSTQRAFAGDWPDLVRVPVTEALVERAETLAGNTGCAAMMRCSSHRRSAGKSLSERRSCWRPSISNSGRPRRGLA